MHVNTPNGNIKTWRATRTNSIGGAVKVPLCSKVVADQEAGRFATKSPHHNSLLILQKRHFLKVLTFTKDFTDSRV